MDFIVIDYFNRVPLQLVLRTARYKPHEIEELIAFEDE